MQQFPAVLEVTTTPVNCRQQLLRKQSSLWCSLSAAAAAAAATLAQLKALTCSWTGLGLMQPGLGTSGSCKQWLQRNPS
jgi:hypothetical protein